MNAQDFVKISNEVVNREKYDIVYNEILVPLIKRNAERKDRELQIIDNAYLPNVYDRLKQLGIKSNLQYLCRQEMKPYLIEKGFEVSHSCYFTYIRW